MQFEEFLSAVTGRDCEYELEWRPRLTIRLTSELERVAIPPSTRCRVIGDNDRGAGGRGHHGERVEIVSPAQVQR